MLRTASPEIVPAILRESYGEIEQDWNSIRKDVDHIQIDITDAIFAGDGTFREISQFKRLIDSHKIELHFMVANPAVYLADIIDLNPARCIFHVESFSGTSDLPMIYGQLRQQTTSQLALAINPTTPPEQLSEHVPLIDYVLCMGYQAGRAKQALDARVFTNMATLQGQHPDIVLAVDGHVGPTTVEAFIQAGAHMLCANTAIFGQPDPLASLKELQTLAHRSRQN